ncbi:hypothetical protein V6N11_077043 [Hibiscus sabdariffa]|uniref:RNase H type-1 domain-containing protein n=1 Tax=Hibiscus sabdariffa TaxID=183260 RepID=A0ABR2TBX1_9ROSI
MEANRITTGSLGALVNNALVIAILNLISLNWEVVVHHIGRSANGVVDSLARLCFGAPIETVTFVEPHVEAPMLKYYPKKRN